MMQPAIQHDSAVVSHLRRVGEIIEDPSRYLFGTERQGLDFLPAMSSDGKVCQATSEKACRWTLRGAILKTSLTLDQCRETFAAVEETAMRLDYGAKCLRKPISHIAALRLIRETIASAA